MENGTILLVDDDDSGVAMILAAWGEQELDVPVVAVRDGDDALDYLHRRGTFAERPAGLPQVVFLDVKMPRVAGLDLLRQVKGDRDLKHIPVVVLTASREAKDVAECYAHGANAYVVKPDDAAELAEVAKHLGLFWVRINEAPQARHRRFWL